MEKKNIKLKNNITQIIGQISKLYKEFTTKENEYYLIGKKEAYEEILNWFIQSHNGELRYVSANSFLNMIQEKLNKTKSAINKTNEEADEEITSKDVKDFRDFKQINFSDLKINDSRKRINRFAQDQSFNLNNDQANLEGENNNNIQFSFFNPFLSYINDSDHGNTNNSNNSPNHGLGAINNGGNQNISIGNSAFSSSTGHNGSGTGGNNSTGLVGNYLGQGIVENNSNNIGGGLLGNVVGYNLNSLNSGCVGNNSNNCSNQNVNSNFQGFNNNLNLQQGNSGNLNILPVSGNCLNQISFFTKKKKK